MRILLTLTLPPLGRPGNAADRVELRRRALGCWMPGERVCGAAASLALFISVYDTSKEAAIRAEARARAPQRGRAADPRP